MSYHQMEADISLPSRPDLLIQSFSGDQLNVMRELVGQEELLRIASVTHGKETNPDWRALVQAERRDLDTLFQAIKMVTGKERPWIMGFASDFARGLLACTDGE